MPDTATPSPTPQRKLKRRLLLIGGPVLLLVIGAYVYLHGGRFISSEDAYVEADKLVITPEVSGSVVQVDVHDNERVAVGQVLCRIDPSAYHIAVDAARAQLISAHTQLATLRATYQAKVAAIGEATEQLAFAERELKRQQTLASGHAGTEAELDQARHAVDAAQRRITVLRQDAATVLASLGGRPGAPDDSFALIAAARARLAAAERDLRKTILRAPIAGIVANVSNVPIGKYLTAGQPAFSLIAVDHVWVEANLKETALTYVKAGDPVSVEIDTYPGQQWSARVASIGPASGAEFALIPAQNASGNWIKVVQRIPVRIDVRNADTAHPLRAGMSAEVDIDTGHTRHLSDVVQLVHRL